MTGGLHPTYYGCCSPHINLLPHKVIQFTSSYHPTSTEHIYYCTSVMGTDLPHTVTKFTQQFWLHLTLLTDSPHIFAAPHNKNNFTPQLWTKNCTCKWLLSIMTPQLWTANHPMIDISHKQFGPLPHIMSINQSNFYSANIPGKARLSGVTAKSVFNSKIEETVP